MQQRVTRIERQRWTGTRTALLKEIGAREERGRGGDRDPRVVHGPPACDQAPPPPPSLHLLVDLKPLLHPHPPPSPLPHTLNTPSPLPPTPEEWRRGRDRGSHLHEAQHLRAAPLQPCPAVRSICRPAPDMGAADHDHDLHQLPPTHAHATLRKVLRPQPPGEGRHRPRPPRLPAWLRRVVPQLHPPRVRSTKHGHGPDHPHREDSMECEHYSRCDDTLLPPRRRPHHGAFVCVPCAFASASNMALDHELG